MSPQQLPKQEALLPESLRWWRLFLSSSFRFTPLFALSVSSAKAEYNNGEGREKILDGGSTCSVSSFVMWSYSDKYPEVTAHTDQKSSACFSGYGKTVHGALSLLYAGTILLGLQELGDPTAEGRWRHTQHMELEPSPNTSPEVTTHKINHLSFLAEILATGPDGIRHPKD